jgi:DnaA family protein
MHPPRQLTLDLVQPPQPTLANFVAGRNTEVLAALEQLVRGTGERLIYVWGEPGSGRSHLLAALAASSGATPGPDAVAPFSDEAGLYLVDDVERLDETDQQRLFVLINAVRASARARLVAAGAAAPAGLALREDVRTRLAWGLVYQLQALSDAEKARALEAHARSRGFTLPAEVTSYLLNHMPRDMRTLVAIIDALDAYALAARRSVTVALVREWAQAAA